MQPLTSEQRRRRWMALAIVALAYILSFFQRFAPAAIAAKMQANALKYPVEKARGRSEKYNEL